ncbi:MAG: ABC transporter substrate-binding protein [Rhodocyclaceae bacterium]|nr:ABC transporter substrate-binding protein [Rhodocyclaceae bacterium]
MIHAVRKTILAAAGFGMLALVGNVAHAADTIKIGVLYSMTGAGSVLGPKQAEAAQMAFDEANAGGGVNVGGKKMKIEVVQRDDETKPAVAISRATEMVRTGGVKIIQGGTFAHVSMALNEEAKKHNFFLMTTNGVPDNFFEKTTKAPYALAILGDTGMVGRGTVDYLVGKHKPKRIVFLMPDYAYGKGAWAGAEATLKMHPQIQAKVIWTPVGAADVTAQLIQAMEFQPDVIAFGQWGKDLITALKQAGEMGLKSKTKLFVNWIIDLVAVGIPPEILEGVDSQTWWYHDKSGVSDAEVSKLTEDFVKKYEARFGAPPDPYIMTAYFGSKEIIRAIEASGSTEPDKMYAALMKNPNFLTAKGPAAWRVDGRPRYKYNAWIISGLPADKRTSKNHWGRIIDSHSGDAFLPDVKSLGW